MADLNIAGHKISPTMAVVFAGGSGIAIWYAWKQHKASAATSSTSVDPVTGLPYSQDSQTDPLTGLTYLAEAQQYGSVAAAESAVAGESSLDYSTAATTGSGLVGTSTDASLVPANEVQGTTYASNAAWAQAVEAGLTDIGYTSTDVAAALGRYLGGLSETSAQATIVQAAVAEYGTPPVGTFQIIQAPAAATTTATTTTTTGATGTFALPSGHSDTPSTTYVDLGWSAVPGAQQYHYQVLTAAGANVSDQMTTATSARVSGLKPKTAYKWRIAVDTTTAKNASPWSPDYSFTTK